MTRLVSTILWIGCLGMPAGLWAGAAHPISSEGSERATSGSGGKIVSFNGRTHVVWQDATEDGYFNRIRSFDQETREWSPTFTLNQALDNHARPVITVDQGGFLHVVLGGHNSSVTHRMSVRANDASAWSEPQTIGDGTYPAVACGPNQTLLLTMRSTPNWNGVDFYRKERD